MEANLKEPLHIEFYGLPGCGKSTVSHTAAEQLRANGIKVYEFSFFYDHNLKPIARKFFKLFLTVCFCLSGPKAYRNLRRLVKENGYVDFWSSFKQIVNIAPKIMFYKKRKKAVYLWDEGLVQSAISLTVNSGMDIKKTEESLFSIVEQREIKKVYLKVDKEIALQRMNMRNSNDSRIECELDENRKQAMMERFEECCKGIRMENVVEEYCVEKTVDRILELID